MLQRLFNMSYELTLRLKSSEPLGVAELLDRLRHAGLHLDPGKVPHGRLDGGPASIRVATDADLPTGARIMVSIPFHRDFVEVHLALLSLERLARAIGAEIVDGDEIILFAGPDEPACKTAFHIRYEKAGGSRALDLEGV
jgi:hypothetical protein